LGYPTRVCNKHFKNPNACILRISKNDKVSLLKEHGNQSEDEEFQPPFVILKPPLQPPIVILGELLGTSYKLGHTL